MSITELMELLIFLSSTDHTGMDREAKCSDTNDGVRGSSSGWTGFLVVIVPLVVTVLLERR